MAVLVEQAQPAHLNGSYAQSSADAATHELHTTVKTLSVDFKRFYGSSPTRVDKKFTVRLSGLSYLPKISSLFPLKLVQMLICNVECSRLTIHERIG